MSTNTKKLLAPLPSLLQALPPPPPQLLSAVQNLCSRICNHDNNWRVLKRRQIYKIIHYTRFD